MTICDECAREKREREILLFAMQTQGSQSDLVTYVAYHDCREYTQVTALPSQNVYTATLELKAIMDASRLVREQGNILLVAMAQKQLATWH